MITFNTKTGKSIYEELEFVQSELSDIREAKNILMGTGLTQSINVFEISHNKQIEIVSDLQTLSYIHQNGKINTGKEIHGRIKTSINKIDSYEKALNELEEKEYNGRASSILNKAISNEKIFLKLCNDEKWEVRLTTPKNKSSLNEW